MRRVTSALFICLFPAMVRAAESSEAATPFSLANVLNMLMGLAVVVALILGLAWVLKKYGRLPVNNQSDMKIVGGLSLGTRERAVLIEVEGQRLLVGVTPGHIQTLHVLEEKRFSQELDRALDDEKN